MEQLEGKYFENTILSLKKAKEGEKIAMRPEFKAELRAALQNRIVMQSELLDEAPSRDWFDLVRQYKYLLTGVPVLAVMILVATNFSNFKVTLPTEQIVPIVADQKNAQVNNQTIVDSLQKKPDLLPSIGYNPPIVTFSADSVMPPADILARARQSGQSSLAANQDVNSVLAESQSLQFTGVSAMEKTAVSTMKVVQPENLGDSSLPAESINTQSVEAVPYGVLPLVDSGVNFQGPAPTETQQQNSRAMPIEINGRVEDSGKVGVPPLPAQENQVVPTPDLKSMAADVAVPLASQAKPLDQQIGPFSEVVPAAADNLQQTLPQAKMMAVTKDVYLDAVVEKAAQPNLAGLKTNLSLSNVSVALIPTNLDPARVAFDDPRRPEVVAVLMKSLADQNGSLSADYYISVSAIENGQFKAILFEYGQVKKVLILGFKDGVLEVLTQIDY